MNKGKRKLNSIVARLSKKLDMDISAIFYFIAKDLDKIYEDNSNIEKPDLLQFEKHIKEISVKRNAELEFKEKELKNREHQLNTEFKIRQNKLENQILDLNKKETLLKDKLSLKEQELNSIFENIEQNKKKLEELGKVIDEQNTINKDISKSVKKEKYEQMMKAHQVREKTDPSQKRLKIYITVFTIVGIIIAILLIKLLK